MLVKGQKLDVNIEEEIEPYMDTLDRVSIRGEELMANSPFRDESNPSFGLNLETGIYNDFGGDGYYKQGNIIKLISYLSDTPIEEVEDYLIAKYGRILSDMDALTLEVDLAPKEHVERTYSPAELAHLAYRSPYLEQRGISEQVQRVFKVGYDRERKAVAMLWQNVKGEIVNVKFRHVRRKSFWYMPDGDAIKNHVYGLNQIVKQGIETAVIVESEIDALYLWSNKIPAIALGRAGMSRKQQELIERSSLKEIVLGLDNDEAGKNAEDRIAKNLNMTKLLTKLEIPENYKDVNEVKGNHLQRLYQSRENVTLNFLNIDV